jgi:hypothetical protein
MSFAHWFSLPSNREEGQMRDIALDVHIDFCEVAIAEAGEVRSAGRISTRPEELELFAGSLAPTDRVALEVTGNAWAIRRIIEPHVAEVIVVSPNDTGIRGARAKTDRLDAVPWPECWPPANSMGCGCPTAKPRSCAGVLGVGPSWSARARGPRTRSTRR